MNEKKMFSSRTMSNNLILNAGVFNKPLRKANLQAVLDGHTPGISVKGSILKINVTNGLEVTPDFYAKLQEVINGHESNLEPDDRTGRLNIVVDLLKLR